MNEGKSMTESLSPYLFWDMDTRGLDWDSFPAYIIQRVLEYGQMDDWRAIRDHYGVAKIAEHCKTLRTLDPVALAFVTCVSGTKKEDYRCYHYAQSNPTLWNS
ncbi:MAG: hypothetical protein LIP02_10120 [Bacteroidales bacterium]|nr:hypothetical protein [Bacteroidales bacterium]